MNEKIAALAAVISAVKKARAEGFPRARIEDIVRLSLDEYEDGDKTC